jgi:hypothetical protein
VQQAATHEDQSAGAGIGTLPDDAPAIPTEEARQNEEMRMLLAGFATGLTIAGVFLIYLVFEYAKWLP